MQSHSWFDQNSLCVSGPFDELRQDSGRAILCQAREVKEEQDYRKKTTLIQINVDFISSDSTAVSLCLPQ